LRIVVSIIVSPVVVATLPPALIAIPRVAIARIKRSWRTSVAIVTPAPPEVFYFASLSVKLLLLASHPFILFAHSIALSVALTPQQHTTERP
jgi:hypothetical protein